MRRIVCSLVVLWLLASCLKAGKYETTYILKPNVQEQSVGEAEPLDGVIAYAYAVDSTDWGVASYADAAAGILTHKTDPGRQLAEPDAVAVPYAPTVAEAEAEGEPLLPTVHWLQMPLGGTACMVVAVDPANRLYGYTMQRPALNLPKLYVSVTFQPWKEGNAYKTGNWSFYNDFYTPPVILKTYFRATWQAGEGDEESAFTSTQVKAYAFLADTTDWRIASYDDAAAGRIVRKTDAEEERTTPNFSAYYEGDSGLLGMEVTATPLMAVVVDRVNRIYAYTQLAPDLEGEPPVWTVVFRPWRSEARYEENGWQLIDESRSQNP